MKPAPVEFSANFSSMINLHASRSHLTFTDSPLEEEDDILSPLYRHEQNLGESVPMTSLMRQRGQIHYNSQAVSLLLL